MSLLRNKIMAMKSSTPQVQSKPESFKPQKAKHYSAPIEAFLVAPDGRITTTKISMDVAQVLKSYNVVVVPASGSSMLTYALSKQFNGKDVILSQMLKCAEFKAAYNAAK
ncbi:hypothetical protein [Pseudomonas oryzihabitans]|uniref:hypothetical protein n=1 Tax=Pseudomonas oryzihabitans TaxID=47885 RepID=UPI002B1CEE16|nr:hypothetical protein [Pseudomonas oryzihabitans]